MRVHAQGSVATVTMIYCVTHQVGSSFGDEDLPAGVVTIIGHHSR